MEVLNKCVVVALDEKETKEVLTSLREQINNPSSEIKNKELTSRIFSEMLSGARLIFGVNFMR